MMKQQSRALVALGANLPHRGLAGAALLAAALREIEAAGLPIQSLSGAWETAPWPRADQPNFVNAVVAIDPGARSPEEVYALLRAVERAFSRERRERWASRTLDLDLLDLNGLKGNFTGIMLPHPRAHERAFVLAPLSEAARDWRHPILGETAGTLLARLPPGQTAVRLGSFAELAGLRIAEPRAAD